MNSKHQGSETDLAPVAKRVPLHGAIDLRFPSFEKLVTAVSSNLSTSGMFIQTDRPEAIGTDFSFQIRIEEWSPIQGSAKVIWSRSKAEGPERPAGMGVRFVELDAESRRMTRWLVDKNLEEGGKPFDLSTVPAGASKFAGRKTISKAAAKAEEPPARKSKTGSAQKARGRGVLFVGLTLLLLLVAGYGAFVLWFDIRPEWPRLRSPGDSGASSAKQIDIDLPGQDLEQPIDAVESGTERVSSETVINFVEDWATAWESREPEGLLALYSDTFAATEYGGRAAWETELTRQMRDSQFIRVAVSAMEISFPTADTARASFYRSFRSNRTDHTRRMILELEPVSDGWKILDERFVD